MCVCLTLWFNLPTGCLSSKQNQHNINCTSECVCVQISSHQRRKCSDIKWLISVVYLLCMMSFLKWMSPTDVHRCAQAYWSLSFINIDSNDGVSGNYCVSSGLNHAPPTKGRSSLGPGSRSVRSLRAAWDKDRFCFLVTAPGRGLDWCRCVFFLPSAQTTRMMTMEISPSGWAVTGVMVPRAELPGNAVSGKTLKHMWIEGRRCQLWWGQKKKLFYCLWCCQQRPNNQWLSAPARVTSWFVLKYLLG